MSSSYKLNELLDERYELMERVDYWVGSEAEENRMLKEIDVLTAKINRTRGRQNG